MTRAQWVAPAPAPRCRVSGQTGAMQRQERPGETRETGCELSEPAPGPVSRVWEHSTGRLPWDAPGPDNLTVAPEPGQLTQSIINFLPRHWKIVFSGE